MTKDKYKYLVFFTKDFPYGIHENYIFNELPYLAQRFEKIFVIPHEEFEYNALQNRLPKSFQNVEIVRINRDLPRLSSSEKVRLTRIAVQTFAFEILNSREKNKHISAAKGLVGQLRHLAHAALKLKNILDAQGCTPENTIIYHYWFHRGVLISHFLNNHLSTQRYTDVARAHSLDLYHKDWNNIYRGEPLFLAFEQTKWRELNRLFPITNHGYNHLSLVFPKHRSKMTVQRLGVPGPGATGKMLSGNSKKIISCSLLNGNKRMFMLPHILKHSKHEIDWYHFGHGSDADKQEIVDNCAKCDVRVTVHFMGLVPNTVIQQFYRDQQIDLIVNLSEAEGLPVALMEAASYSIPMLATSTVGNPEIVSDENGILIPVDFDPNKVGEQINHLFDHPEIWKSKSLAARKTWEDGFDADQNYRAFADLLQGC